MINLPKLTPEQQMGLTALVRLHGLANVVEMLSIIATEEHDDSAAEWLASLVIELRVR